MGGWIQPAVAGGLDTLLNMTWLHVEHLDWEIKEENGIVANHAAHKGTIKLILKKVPLAST